MTQLIQPEVISNGDYFILRFVANAPSAGAATANLLLNSPVPFVISRVTVEYTGGTSITTGVTTPQGTVQFGAPAASTVDPGPGAKGGYNTAAVTLSTPPELADEAYVAVNDEVNLSYTVTGSPTNYIVEVQCLRITEPTA